MGKTTVFRREELMTSSLDLGGYELDLADYATTGMRIVAVASTGGGKTNAGLLIAEQLSEQGWVTCIFDPEGEIEALFGGAVSSPDELKKALAKRDRKILVIPARTPSEFVPYGEVILEAADTHRKPLLVVADEGQLWSNAKARKKNNIGEASDILNDFVERGRKRSLDLFITAHRYTGSLNRSVFGNKSITLIGNVSDPTAWSALAAQFKGTRIGFSDLMALGTGEFFAFTRRGVEKVRLPMSKALAKVAPKARPIRPDLPVTFSQWDRALREIPTVRLGQLTDPVVSLLGQAAGLTTEQIVVGSRALHEEMEARA